MVPRLFIHLTNGEGFQRDERGEDYATEEAGIHQAALAAGAILSDDLIAGKTVPLKLDVTRADGSHVATITVTATIERSEASTAQ